MADITMKYMLLIYGNEAGDAGECEQGGAIEQMVAAYAAYTEAMKKAGVLLGANRLKPTSTAASTVRVADGKTKVLDGPYAETKEQLGGYYLIDVPDLDAALSWAARCLGASHGVQHRSAAHLGNVRPCRRDCSWGMTASMPTRGTAMNTWHAAATASWSPFSQRAAATSRGPRTRCPRPSPPP